MVALSDRNEEVAKLEKTREKHERRVKEIDAEIAELRAIVREDEAPETDLQPQ